MRNKRAVRKQNLKCGGFPGDWRKQGGWDVSALAKELARIDACSGRVMRPQRRASLAARATRQPRVGAGRGWAAALQREGAAGGGGGGHRARFYQLVQPRGVRQSGCGSWPPPQSATLVEPAPAVLFDLLDVSIDPEFLDENDCVCRLRLQHRTKNHWLDRRMVKDPGIPWACSAVPLPPGIAACLPIYCRQPVVRAPRSNCTGTPSLFVSDSCGLLHR